MQHLKPEGGLHFFVNGAGGAKIRPSPHYERTLFSLSTNGFASIEADTKNLQFKFFDTDLRLVYQYEITKMANTMTNATVR